MEALKHRLIRAFWLTLAVLFLIESWLWDHVKEWLRALVQRLGLSQLEARLRDFIASLSPHATLAVFAIPALSVLPVKILALDMIASGHLFWGLVVIFAAKTLALGVTAFLFDLCRDKLMQIAWFVKFYSLVLRVNGRMRSSNRRDARSMPCARRRWRAPPPSLGRARAGSCAGSPTYVRLSAAAGRPRRSHWQIA